MAMLPVGGSGGMPPPGNFLNFRPSEIASGAIFQTVCDMMRWPYF